MLLWLLFVCFLTRSNLRFLLRLGLPLGRVRLTSACFFFFFFFFFFVSSCLPMLVSFFCLSPLRSSALFASGVILVSCSPGELSFSLVIYLIQGWFSWAFLVPLRLCRFRPSSGSSLLSFHCSSLRSLLPFRSWFLCCSLCILFPLGILSLSLSLPWPFFLTPVTSSVSPCFWALLLRSMASSAVSFSLAAGSLVVWCPFCFSVRLPSSMRCFLFPFLVPVFSLLDVSSLAHCLFPLGPSGFRPSFCFRTFRWALLRLSYLSFRLVCFAIGLFHSLLVPGSSFLLFSFSLYLLLLVPSFPPLARWFCFCCLASGRLVRFLWVVFRILFFCGAVLSLPYIPSLCFLVL